MKVKKIFQEIFSEEQKRSDQAFRFELQNRILDSLPKKKPVKNYWNIFFPAVSFALILIIIGVFSYTKFVGPHNKAIHYNIIPKVSAESILKDMQASINSERLHFTMQTNGGWVDETWIDRKKYITRYQRTDNKGRLKTFIIAKGLPSDSKTYRFITDEQGRLEQPIQGKKVGIFVGREDNDGYEIYINDSIKKDYIKLLKQKDLIVEPSYESIKYEGRDAYKITLKYIKHKPKQVDFTEIFTIDKETKLPYEQLFIESGPETVGGDSQTKIEYSFSTNFSDDVFALTAPEGYSMMKNPNVINFFFTTVDGFKEGAEQTLKNSWPIKRILNVTIADYPIDAYVVARGGMVPVGYKTKLFIVRKIFGPDERVTEADHVNLPYEEIKSQKFQSKQNYLPSQVYILPDIPGNKFVPKSFIMFRLEVINEKGKKYNLVQGFTLEELLKVQYGL